MSDYYSTDSEDVAEPEYMISWKERTKFAVDVRLDGEDYYDDVLPSDDEEESIDKESVEDKSIEEAKEIDEQQLAIEEIQAAALFKFKMTMENEQRMERALAIVTANVVEPCHPSLPCMPDIVLEHILHFATNKAHDVCVYERVCKRIRQITLRDEFWNRRFERGSTIGFFESMVRDVESSREKKLLNLGVRNIRSYQKSDENQILCVLDSADTLPETFRTVVASVVARMIHIGHGICFRLRGDTVGYLAEILQEYMCRRLQDAVLFAIHDGRTEVQSIDMRRLTGRCILQGPCLTHLGQQVHPPCNVNMKEHGKIESVLDCSCSLSSISGTIWRWPDDDCHDVLPAEAGRRIIRRIAYCAGVNKMSSDAFVAAEAEFLHTMGILVVDALESSVQMAKSSAYRDASQEVCYNAPRRCTTLDTFEIPPPPLRWKVEDCDITEGDIIEEIYTIVPGQIRAAAERRNIFPYHVYGDTWIPSNGFTVEEEKAIEESYYYKLFDADSSDSEDEGGDDVEEENLIENEEDLEYYLGMDWD
jgi:histone H3/H4